MNVNVQNMITLSAAVALFLSACYFTLGLTSHIHTALDEASLVSGGQTKSVYTTLKTAKPDTFSGSQAIIITVDQIKNGVQILVDSAPVTEDDPVWMMQQSIFQFDARYRAMYKRDVNGKLIEIHINKLSAGEVDP
ncbi:hypothetical protein MUG84_12405 [Paenibacillus sp. KQZ6P-2]|uniref:Uncharacterized protein n=1 Tax=Paenibacillus mangrovi TaxID=2931978 RepID=A0A9X1WNJ6_9BACL|nr:hypothetical protein [Paenibacillus mangrovi]MCJ8012532.1 hypothetical protein [Paenibacillus mangrovi]